jgi:phosphatidate cytidylyltransferase
VFGAYRSVHAGQAVGVLVLFLGTIAWLLADARRHDVVRTLATTLLLGLWTGFLGSFAVLLVNRPEDGAIAVLAVIGSAVFGDIGGYATGVMLGRHKIAPHISPNKTVEGLVGGVVVTAVLAAVVLPLVGDLFDVTSAVAVAVVCVLAGFVGDLTESMIKRDLGVKDLGRVIPGHGGILDRVDGILLALPVGFYVVSLLT